MDSSNALKTCIIHHALFFYSIKSPVLDNEKIYFENEQRREKTREKTYVQ